MYRGEEKLEEPHSSHAMSLLACLLDFHNPYIYTGRASACSEQGVDGSMTSRHCSSSRRLQLSRKYAQHAQQPCSSRLHDRDCTPSFELRVIDWRAQQAARISKRIPPS